MTNANSNDLPPWCRGSAGMEVRTIKAKRIYRAWRWGMSIRLEYPGNTLSGIKCKFITPEEFNKNYYLNEPE